MRNEKLYELIRSRIDKTGLPLSQVAEKSGVSYNVLWTWLRGETEAIRAGDVGKLSVFLRIKTRKLTEFLENGDESSETGSAEGTSEVGGGRGLRVS